MAELTIIEFEMDKLTAPALSVFKAAVMHAQKNRGIRLHRIPITVFCRLAGIPGLSSKEIQILLNEARKVLAIREVIDTASPNRDDLPYLSWPVFTMVLVDELNVSFEICQRTFDERLLSRLPDLKVFKSVNT